MNRDQVSSLSSDISHFLAEHASLYNFSNVRVLSEDRLSRLPQEWRKVLAERTVEDVKRALLQQVGDAEEVEDPVLQFARTRNDLLARVEKVLLSHPPDPLPPPPLLHLPASMLRKMTPKKQHEVHLFSNHIAHLCRSKGVSLVIDVGSGLAYLPQALSLMFGLRVLTIECHGGHCVGAEERVGGDQNVTQFRGSLDESEEGRRLWGEVIGAVGEEFAVVVGLHCCGDLTPEILRRFGDCKRVRAVSVISCCYHKMKEARNMPLSRGCAAADVVQRQPDVLFGPHALRLASLEPLSQWLRQSKEDHDRHSRAFGYRAALEAFCASRYLSLRKIRRRGVRKTRLASPEDFVADVLNGYELVGEGGGGSDGNDDFLRQGILAECLVRENIFPQLENLTAFQLSLQCLLECVVLADRCMFLLEKNFEDVRLETLFDESISPRNKVLTCCR